MATSSSFLITNECEKSLQLIKSLEKYTLGGRHICGNSLIVSIIYELKNNIERMRLMILSDKDVYNPYLINRNNYNNDQDGSNANINVIEIWLEKYRQDLVR